MLPLEVRLDKWLDFSIHHRLDISDARIRSMVFNHRVGLEDVGADLTPPRNFFLFNGVLRPLFILLCSIVLVEATSEHFKGNFLIHDLAALVLTLYDDPRFKVGDSNCAIGLIDVLAACPSRSIRIEAIIFRLEVDFDRIVNYR